jgi:hypothetical protein
MSVLILSVLAVALQPQSLRHQLKCLLDGRTK